MSVPVPPMLAEYAIESSSVTRSLRALREALLKKYNLFFQKFHFSF